MIYKSKQDALNSFVRTYTYIRIVYVRIYVCIHIIIYIIYIYARAAKLHVASDSSKIEENSADM